MNRIVLFGDSITAGVVDGYPSTLMTTSMEHLLPHCEIINRGMPGDFTSQALSRLMTDVIAPNPTVVVLFFGTNDVCYYNEETYLNNIEKMTTACNHTAAKSILVTPGITGTKAQQKRPNEKLAVFAEQLQQWANTHHYPVYDWHNEMAALHKQKVTVWQDDDIHYSKEAYFALCQGLATLILPMLPHYSDILDSLD